MKRSAVVSTLLVTGLLAVILFRRGPHLYDDAFITMRYARHLAAGDGLVYNPGERVLGTSTPLYAAMLAVPGAALGPGAIPAIGVGIGFAALFATALLLLRLLSPGAPAPVALLAVAAALTPLETARVFASGMETPLYLAALAGALLLLSLRRDRWAFLAAGLLPFVHPEGVLLFAALALAIRLRDGRWPLGSMLPGAAAALAGAAALTAWFGSPLPASIGAKRAAYVLAPFTALGELARAALEVLLPPRAPDLVQGASPGAALAWEAGVPLLALLLLGALFRFGRRALARPEVAAAALFASGYLAAFAAGNPLVFPWYGAPLVVSVAVVVGALVGEAARGDRASRAVAGAGTTVLALGTLLRLALLQPYDASDREELYRVAALRMNAAPADVVLAPEIGALGFYTPARIWDTSGLVTPAALRFRGAEWRERERGPLSIGGGTIPPGVIEAVRPDWIVALSRFLDPLLRVSPRALDGYELFAEYPTERWGSRAVVVYRKRR
ncbi:MAG: hypothetical protein U0529_10920 [Thermoanaerobaculia bacterium]